MLLYLLPSIGRICVCMFLFIASSFTYLLLLLLFLFVLKMSLDEISLSEYLLNEQTLIPHGFPQSAFKILWLLQANVKNISCLKYCWIVFYGIPQDIYKDSFNVRITSFSRTLIEGRWTSPFLTPFLFCHRMPNLKFEGNINPFFLTPLPPKPDCS